MVDILFTYHKIFRKCTPGGKAQDFKIPALHPLPAAPVDGGIYDYLIANPETLYPISHFLNNS